MSARLLTCGSRSMRNLHFRDAPRCRRPFALRRFIRTYSCRQLWSLQSQKTAGR